MNAPACKEVEDLVRSKVSNKDFDFVRKKLKLCASGVIHIDSNHVASKESRSMIKPYKVNNAENSNDASNVISTTNQSSTNLVTSEENKFNFSSFEHGRFKFI